MALRIAPATVFSFLSTKPRRECVPSLSARFPFRFGEYPCQSKNPCQGAHVDGPFWPPPEIFTKSSTDGCSAIPRPSAPPCSHAAPFRLCSRNPETTLQPGPEQTPTCCAPRKSSPFHSQYIPVHPKRQSKFPISCLFYLFPPRFRLAPILPAASSVRSLGSRRPDLCPARRPSPLCTPSGTSSPHFFPPCRCLVMPQGVRQGRPERRSVEA